MNPPSLTHRNFFKKMFGPFQSSLKADAWWVPPVFFLVKKVFFLDYPREEYTAYSTQCIECLVQKVSTFSSQLAPHCKHFPPPTNCFYNKYCYIFAYLLIILTSGVDMCNKLCGKLSYMLTIDYQKTPEKKFTLKNRKVNPLLDISQMIV